MNKVAQIKLMSKVLQAVSEHLNVNVFDVLSSCRKPDLVDARQMAMLLRRERGMSLKNIGRFMNRDHSTVIYDVNTVWSRIEVYPHFQTLYDELSQTLCALN